MPGAATRPTNFFECITFVQFHGMVHGIKRFQITGFVAVFARGFQAGGQHFLSEALAPAFTQEVHFLQFARIAITALQWPDTAPAQNFAILFVHKICMSFLRIGVVHIFNFRIVNGKALAAGAKLWHYRSYDVLNR